MVDLFSFGGVILTLVAGLPLGAALKFISREEVKQGKHFLEISQYTILGLMIAAFAGYYNSMNIYYLTAAVILSVGSVGLLIQKIPYWIQFLFLGGIAYIASNGVDVFVIVSSLIFVYNLITGSLICLEKDWKKKILLNAGVLFVSGVALFCVFLIL